MLQQLMSILANGSSGQTPIVPVIPPEKYISFGIGSSQSNDSGREDISVLSGDYLGVQEDIFIYNISTGTIEPYHTGVNSTQDMPGGNRFGKELYLARLLRDYHQKKVLIFKYSVGGSRLAQDTGTDWSVNSVGELRDQMWTAFDIFKVRNIQKNIDPLLYAWLRTQGEQDALQLNWANAYKAEEALVFADIFAKIPSLKKILNVNINSTSEIYDGIVRQAKIENALEIPNILLNDIDGFPKLDGVHLNNAGLILAATQDFNAIKDLWNFTA